ncbi:MAG: oligopeptide/dipeptide transporter, permease protein [Thermomicrobiales bacterium]|nr:oligopeptide/dipeptide transporter, permease protein [Thermomicrobiales bacterium]
MTDSTAPPLAATNSVLTRPLRKPQVFWEQTVQRLLHDRAGVVGLAIIGLLVAAAVFAPVIAPADPYEIGSGFPFTPPSSEHLMGTDDLGRDVFSRVLYGARVSLRVAVFSVAAALVIAVPLGLAAGYFGGPVDTVISRLFDTIFAFPAILLGIGFVAVLGPDLQNVIIAVAIINIPTIGRLIRATVLGQRDQDYVEAIRVAGASTARITFGHILPNAIPPLFVQVALAAGEAVLLEAAFSFLGLGSRPPTPSWGTMLNEGRRFLDRAPWLGFFPGLAITLMIFGLNSLGDGVRNALDPHRWRQTTHRTEAKGA